MAKSSKPRIVNVRGVLFSPKPDFVSLEAWRDAGYPSNCTVRDTPYWLRISGIPITDAVENNGRFVRGTPRPEVLADAKPRKVQVSEKSVSHTRLKYDDWPNLLPLLHATKEPSP